MGRPVRGSVTVLQNAGLSRAYRGRTRLVPCKNRGNHDPDVRIVLDDRVDISQSDELNARLSLPIWSKWSRSGQKSAKNRFDLRTKTFALFAALNDVVGPRLSRRPPEETHA